MKLKTVESNTHFVIINIFTRIAGIIGVIESLIWIIFASLAIAGYYCHWDIDTIIKPENVSSIFSQAFLLIYFYNSCRDEKLANYLGKSFYIRLRADIYLSSQIIHIVIWFHLILTFLWAFVSLLMIFSIDNKAAKRTIAIISLWIVLVIVLSTVDIILGIIFGLDMSNFNERSARIGDIPVDVLMSAYASSAIMAITSLKGGLLLIINLSLAVFLFIKIMRISKILPSAIELDNKGFNLEPERKKSVEQSRYYYDRSPIAPRLRIESLERANEMSANALAQRRSKWTNLNQLENENPYRSSEIYTAESSYSNLQPVDKVTAGSIARGIPLGYPRSRDT